MSIHLLIGLGNPGEAYARHRHNIGFMAVDHIHRHFRGAEWRARFSSLCAEITVEGQKILLLKPQTYMNESGRAVGEMMRFYKLTLRALHVFHDELDLPFAKIRVKTGGGNAGHNGLKSISAHCGGEFERVRLGIGHPGDKARVHDYVLGNFNTTEQSVVEPLMAALALHLPLLFGAEGALQNRMALESQKLMAEKETGFTQK